MNIQKSTKISLAIAVILCTFLGMIRAETPHICIYNQVEEQREVNILIESSKGKRFNLDIKPGEKTVINPPEIDDIAWIVVTSKETGQDATHKVIWNNDQFEFTAYLVPRLLRAHKITLNRDTGEKTKNSLCDFSITISM